MRKSFSFLAIFALAAAASLPAAAQDWKAVGPPGGDVESLGVAPGGSQSLYIGSEDGHVFRSQDGGGHWSLAGRVGAHHDDVVTTILVDPRSSKTLYASSWTLNSDGGGVWRSSDSGTTWQILGLAGEDVRALAEAPSNPDILVAGTISGVFRSRDAGRTWERISPEHHDDLRNFDSLAIDPRDPDTIYAGTFHLPWKTTDGGRNWAPIHTGMAGDSDVMSLSVDPRDSQHIFASACSGIYSSHNGGTTWLKFTGIPKASHRTVHLVQDPVNPLTLYAATTTGLWKTTNDGAEWRLITPESWSILSIVIDPVNSSRLILGTERLGIEISEDGGGTYRAANDGFSHRRIADLATDPQHPERALVVLTNAIEPVLETRDGGRTWKPLSAGLTSGPPRRVFASPNGWLAAPAPGGLLRYDESRNAWAAENEVVEKPAATPAAHRSAATRTTTSHTANSASTPKPKTAPVAKPTMVRSIVPLQAVVNDVVFSAGAWFAATEAGLYVSRDAGQTWTVTPLSTPGVVAVRAAFVQGSSVWAVTAHTLEYSGDGGQSWVQHALPVEARQGAHLDVTGDAILLAGDRGFFISRDDGLSWRQSPLPELSIEDMIVTANTVVVSTRAGLYASNDVGRTWTRLAEPPESAASPIVRPYGAGAELLAASPTEGLFEARITSAGATAEPSRDVFDPQSQK